MTSKSLLFFLLGSIAALISSCAPLVPYRQRAPLQAVAPDVPPAPSVNSAQQKRIKKVRKKVASSSKPVSKPRTTSPSSASSGGTSSPPSTTAGGPPTSQKPSYRYALQIPGKEGFVFNPFTNNPVDVRGIPSGTLVRDPQDSNSDHKFRVP